MVPIALDVKRRRAVRALQHHRYVAAGTGLGELTERVGPVPQRSDVDQDLVLVGRRADRERMPLPERQLREADKEVPSDVNRAQQRINCTRLAWFVEHIARRTWDRIALRNARKVIQK